MGDSGGYIDFQLYRYTPSFAAAVVFIVLFFLTTLYHICQLVKSRSWYFIAFVMGGIRKLLNLSIMPQFLFFGDSPQAYHADPSDPKVQIIGYIARAMAHTNTKSVPIYAIQIILILLAPPLYAASIYMVLGRLILHLRAQLYSVVPLKWMTGIFVTGDVIAFLMQAAGGGIMASGTVSSMTTGEHITMAGLCVQLVFFTFFLLTSLLFHARIRSNPTQQAIQATQDHGMHITRSWESVIWGLYTASVLILIRSVFRLIEYAQGNDGYLISHEAFMYGFDSTLMLFAMVAMNVLHPSVILSSTQMGDQNPLETL